MAMLDKGTAQVEWRLTGSVSGAEVDIAFTSVLTLNLLTGRVESHREGWDLSRLPAAASFLVTANRAAWSARQASADAQEGIKKAVDDISSTLSIDDEPEVYRDPTDPTKFFQGGERDQNKQDMITFAMIMIALYAVFTGFSTIIKL
ncbi:hypothetical protein FOA52_015268 [Chlamydomonas sp. UWO 241]|nr:hypothetical protein FOA52_015268 [Chlamydomonas sp. UWO 241]